MQADTELAEMAYKNEQLELQKQQLEQENYWKKKQYELQKQAYSSSGSSDPGSAAGNSAYNAVMYNDMMSKFAACKTADEMQALYDSLVGTNTEAAQSVYGSYYTKLLSEVREGLLDKRAEEDDDGKIREICTMMTKVGANPNAVFINLYRDSMLTDHPQYTTKQVEEAYKRVIRLWE